MARIYKLSHSIPSGYIYLIVCRMVLTGCWETVRTTIISDKRIYQISEYLSSSDSSRFIQLSQTIPTQTLFDVVSRLSRDKTCPSTDGIKAPTFNIMQGRALLLTYEIWRLRQTKNATLNRGYIFFNSSISSIISFETVPSFMNLTTFSLCSSDIANLNLPFSCVTISTFCFFNSFISLL